MKPILIFDLGKVLVDFDYTLAAEKIGARSVNPPEFHQFFDNLTPVLVQYETGLITRQEFFDEVREAVGFQGSPMGYRTYIFSNTNDLAIEHVRQDFPFFADFDGHILSYEVKAMKPNPAIYEAMEAMCGAKGDQLVYIDDRAENIAGGAARGWRTVLHETPEKTRAALHQWGINV